VILRERFLDLLVRFIPRLRISRDRATGLAPCHEDRSPSFSADLEKLVWYCHACGRGGGVKDFARVVGEPWSDTHSESRPARARRARLQAERQARTILERRAEEQNKKLCTEHRELYGDALAAADVLSLFNRRPDLAAEISELVTRTEREYGEVLFRLSVLEARLDGEVE
jgi:hypothetical protein